jgi:hypothetical protein
LSAYVHLRIQRRRVAWEIARKKIKSTRRPRSRAREEVPVLQLLEAIENSAYPTFVRESPSLWAYTLVLSLHAMGLAIVVGLSSAIALRVLGRAPSIPLAPLGRLFPVMYVGFWVNALSGLALLAANATGMLANALFWVKIVFIAGGVLVMRLLRRNVFNDALAAGGALPPIARRLAIASLVCWGAALIAGRLTAYPYLIEYYFGI